MVALTSQNSGTRVLDSSQTRLDMLRKTDPELLWAVPMAQVGRVVAEGIAVLGASSAGRVNV